MRIKRLIAHDFRGWKLLDVNLDAYSGVTAIVGRSAGAANMSNGVGKSSLLMAISFVLYGDKGDAAKYEDLKRIGAEDFNITLHVSGDDGDYIISRKRNKNRSYSVTAIGPDGKYANKDWEKRLGLPPQLVWDCTVYAAQGKLGGLLDLLPSARKDLLTEVFGLSKYLTLERKARDKANVHASLVTEAQGALDSLLSQRDASCPTEAQLANLKNESDTTAAWLSEQENTISVAESRLELAKETRRAAAEEMSRASESANQISVAKAQLRGAMSAAESHVLSCERKQKEYESAQAELKELSEMPGSDDSALDKLEKDSDSCSAEYVALMKQKEPLTARLSEIKASLASNAAQLNKFAAIKGKCPTCGAAVNDASVEQAKGQLISANANLAQELQTLSDKIAGVQKASDAISRRKEALSAQVMQARAAAKSLSALLSRKARAEQIVSSWLKEADALEQSWQVLQDAVTEATARVKSMESDANQLTILKAALNKASDACTEAENLLASEKRKHASGVAKAKQFAAEVAVAESRIAAAKRLEAQIAEAEQKHRTEEQQVRVLNELVCAFGPGGIPNLLLTEYLREMQDYLDQYATVLSGGKLRVVINASKTYRTGKMQEGVYIDVESTMGVRDIETYSGGEKVRVQLIVRLALAKLLSVKFGMSFQTIIMDEVQFLDESGAAALMELLDQLTVNYPQIFLVSHVDNLKDSVGNVLVLDKDHDDTFVG